MVPTPRGDTQSSTVPITTVLELFTSQGCSSCPPADAMLKTYAENPSVVALSMPVDYWDYLGWKDTFASPRNAERQRAYAKARGDGAIYTPQLVVNGMLHVNGSSKADIDNAIDLTTKNVALSHVPIRIWQAGGTLNISVGGVEPGREAQEATIWLALVQPSATVDIQKGENAGSKLLYTNIVHELTPVGLWRGSPDHDPDSARRRHAGSDAEVGRVRAGGQGRPHSRRRLGGAVVGHAASMPAYAARPRFFSKPSILGGRPRKAT